MSYLAVVAWTEKEHCHNVFAGMDKGALAFGQMHRFVFFAVSGMFAAVRFPDRNWEQEKARRQSFSRSVFNFFDHSIAVSGTLM
ncbi:MAG: hypothetical protein ACI4QT_09120 [Kiritimatiellia bacterium]